MRRQIGDRIIRKAPDFEITLVASGEADRPPPGHRPPREMPPLVPYLWSGFAVVIAAGAAYVVDRFMPVANLSLVFLTAVLVVATRYGLWPSLFTSAASFLAYNFFFTEPYHTFTVHSRDDILTISLFLLTAILAGNLAGRLKMQVEAMRATTRRTGNLYDFSRRIAGAATLEDVLWAAVHHVASTLQCRVLVLLPNGEDRLEIASGYPPEDQLAPRDWAAADWAWQHDVAAGWGSDTLPSADWLFLPIKTPRGRIGLLGIAFEGSRRVMSPDQRRLLETLVEQVAVAVERTQLVTDIEEARVVTETEALRTALLSSVSHDLRTPLVSIIGSATTLADSAGGLSADDRRQLAQTILEEGERLNRFVQNLLDMTRLGYGALQLNKEWADLREIAGRAIRRLQRPLQQHNVELDVPADLPAVRVDPVLIEQVLANLLENAAKYAPAGSRIMVRGRRRAHDVVIDVCDEGPGIPAEAREAVFDVFYRVRAGDQQTAGTGLGLSICRGLVEAHGGRIVAMAGPGDRGTVIQFTLPLEPIPAIREEKDQAAGD